MVGVITPGGAARNRTGVQKRSIIASTCVGTVRRFLWSLTPYQLVSPEGQFPDLYHLA